MPRFMQALPGKQGEMRGRLALKCAGCRGREPTEMSTAVALADAGHGPVRHDHLPGDAVDDGMWSGRRASNSRPQAWEAGALPTELRPHGAHCTMIFARLPSSPCLRGKPAAPSPGTSDRRLWATPFPSVKRGGTEDCVSSDLQHSPDGGRATGLRLTGSASPSLSWRVLRTLRAHAGDLLAEPCGSSARRSPVPLSRGTAQAAALRLPISVAATSAPQTCARSLSRILLSPSWILLLLRPRRRQMHPLPFP